MTVSGVSASGSGGIRNERLGLRKTSITVVDFALRRAGDAAHSVSSAVGRRMPRASVPVSVSALNTFSQICAGASRRRARRNAFSACRSSACAIVPMAS